MADTEAGPEEAITAEEIRGEASATPARNACVFTSVLQRRRMMDN